MESFVAGWFGGVCVLAVCHPFDTLKVRIQGASFDNRNLVDLETKIKERQMRLAQLEQRKNLSKRFSSVTGWQTAFKEALASTPCKYRRVMANRLPQKWLQTPDMDMVGTSSAAVGAESSIGKAALSDVHAKLGANLGGGPSLSSSPPALSKVASSAPRPICTAPVRLSSSDTFGVMCDIFHGEGMRGFYKGIAAPLSGVGLATAAQFGAYGYVSNYLSRLRYGGDVHSLSDHLQNSNSLDVLDKVVSATCGGVAYAMIIAPFEMVKVRLQTQIYFDHRKYFGALGCARKLYSEGGLRKLYLGIDVMLLRDIFGSVVYFGSYGLLRQSLPQGDARENIASTLFAGGCAGVTQWALIFPLDTIKTRQQIAKQGTYIDWIHCGRVLYRKEGARAFYYGMGPALVRAFMGNAICFGGVETALAMMEKLSLRGEEEEEERDFAL